MPDDIAADPELAAMWRILFALLPLDTAARRRVLDYALLNYVAPLGQDPSDAAAPDDTPAAAS
jgi:hypothetical protein